MKLLLGLALSVALGRLTSGSRFRSRVSSGVSESDQVHNSLEREQTSVRGMVGSMVNSMFAGKGPNVHDIARAAHKRMRFDDALPRLESKLPTDVLSLVRMTGHSAANKSSTKGQFSEVSLAKARVYMNTMMYDSWLQLDAVVIECKEFEESNRDTFGQVVTDLEHIGSDLADRSRMKVEAEGGIAGTSLRIKEAEEFRDKEKREFMTIRSKNAYELQLRQDDQDVFDAVLNMTKCPNEDDNSYSLLAQMQICNTATGVEIQSANSTLMENLNKSPRIKKALLEALGETSEQHSGSPALLQTSADARRGSAAEARQAPPPIPVSEEPHPEGQWKKCNTPQEVNCGLLHDTMALEWGKFKDLVDELTTLMEHNADVWKKQSENLNEQITSLRSSKSKHQELLGEAVSEINSLTAETTEKEQQHRDLEQAYSAKMKECKDRTTEILFTNICATRVVRNQLMEYSEETPPSAISDCDFTDWAPGECSVDCDDGCPADVGGIDVDVCGGMQKFSREIVVMNNTYGMACPPMVTDKKCNQIKCPVNCAMSSWSGFSACSKECGGGTQGKTRAVLAKPKNGGSECDTTLEERSCNTGSCDRDCTMTEWTAWEPCSMACGGGLQKRARNVIVPIRANGKCPKSDHPDRLEEQACNTQECQGDEICIAKQDLILAIDASGSLKEEGFAILRYFAYNLTGRYQNMYYGVEDMKIGVVLFGNGEYNWRGIVTEAIEAQKITGDLEAVRTVIEGLEWQRGFTNMMQAFQKADQMFLEKGREDAQSAVLMLSDGKYTNAFRTSQKVQQLKDKNIQIFMAPVATFESDNLQVIKGWSSSPWETNYERIPGLEALENNEDAFAQQLLVKFCPMAFSPSLKLEVEEQRGYLLIHEEGFPTDECGAWKRMPGLYEDVQSCMERVKQDEILAFAYMTGSRTAGICFSEAIDVTQDVWEAAVANRTSQACPNGEWEYDKYASTYIMNPFLFKDLIPED